MSLMSMLHPASSPSAAAHHVAIEPQFDFCSEEYQALHLRSQATAFQGPRWLHCLYRDVAPALTAEPVIVTVRETKGGRLVLVLPMISHRRNGMTFVEFADFGLCDYLRAVYDPVDAPPLLTDVTLRERVAALLPPCDVISLTKLTGDDLVLERLFSNARRARMRVSAYPVRVGPDWVEWRSTNLEYGFRRDLEIKRRRIAKRGTPVFALVRGHDEIVRAFDALRNFRTQRFRERGDHDILDNEAIFSFYRQIAVDGSRAETARTFCLYLSGVPVAVMFGLVHRRTFYLLLVGFNLAQYRRLSLGLLAIEDTLRTSFEAGDAVYDFTIGDYPYKLQFGAKPTPLYEWHIVRTIRGYLAVFGINFMREAKRVLKPLVRGKLPVPSVSPAVNDH
jgi:CelD/BcsL family acetyltransferase involved in cellulose biosynthesis